MRGKQSPSNAEQIERHRAKIAELERSVEALREKEALRVFRLAERAGWFEVSVPDDAYVDAIGALVERYRHVPAGRSSTADAAADGASRASTGAEGTPT